MLTHMMKIDLAYMPILPVAQVFVSIGEGYFEQASIEPNLVSFQNGAAIAEALYQGKLDGAYLGIGTAMIAKANGVDLKVVAAGIIEQINFIARGSLPSYFDQALSVASAISQFASEQKRPVKIATFPAGTVPETVLHYWFANEGVNPADVDIHFMGSAKVQQALLSKAVYAASIVEPVVSITLAQLDDARVVARGGELFPNQPGVVLIVREEFIARQPETVQALVDMHIHATNILNTDAERATKQVHPFVGGDRLEENIVIQAIRNLQGGFVADPTVILEATRVMHDFQKAQGTLTKDVDLDELFDLSFYEQAQ